MMRKTKVKGKENLKGQKAITLIALVITIVVLLILAGVTINTLTGQNGLLTKASEAKEKTEIAQIKEEADLVKLGLNMDYLANRENTERLKKNILLSALNDHFEDSTLQINRIVTSDEKYDIIVRNNLDIVVVKHGGDYLEDGEIELSYYYDETETENNVKVEIYPEVGGVKSYQEYAEEILAGITDNEEKGRLFVEGFKYNVFGSEVPSEAENITEFADWMNYCAELGMFEEGTQIPTTIEEFLNYINGREDVPEDEKMFHNVDEMLIGTKCVKPAEYLENYGEEITITCSNGQTVTTNTDNLYAEFTIGENGTYTYTATSTNGATGEVTIDINNIVGEDPIINSVLAERTSEGLKVTVNATNVASYQFKIDDGSYSKSQTSNVYNYNINYSEAKTSSSTTNPYIPRGFVHTEGTVDEGYVIRDLPKDYTLTVKAINLIGRKETTVTKTITGSEFVWVPVDNDSSTVYPSLTRGVTGKELSSDYIEELGNSSDITSVQYFIDSVNTNGGFYIERYKAGMPGNISGDIPVLEANSSARNKIAKPISRKNVMAWDYISYNNAKASSESMYNLNTDGVQSQLINSYAWDTVLNWAIASGDKTQEQIIKNSISLGNYYSSSFSFSGLYSVGEGSNEEKEILSGTNINKPSGKIYKLGTGVAGKRNSIKNIFDMAGSWPEITTEFTSKNEVVLRGESYEQIGDYWYYNVSGRTETTKPTHVNVSYGFRVVLCK